MYQVSEQDLLRQRTRCSIDYRSFYQTLDHKLRQMPMGMREDALLTLKSSADMYTSVLHSVGGICQADSAFRNGRQTEDFTNIYSAYISGRVMEEDAKRSENRFASQVQDTRTETPVVNLGSTLYGTTQLAMNGLADRMVQSGTDTMHGYWNNYSNQAARIISLSFSPVLMSHVSQLEWKIGPYCIKGVETTPILKDGMREDSIRSREISQFYTALDYLAIPKHERKPRDRIIGDQSIISACERSVRFLMLYNTKSQKNPVPRRQFKQFICLQGESGMGKGAVCNYLIDYAERLNAKLGSDLLVSKLSFASSLQKGQIQKLQSQFRQISEMNRPILLFQDELDGDFSPQMNGATDINIDVQKEFARFTFGEYENRGNYLILATINDLGNISKEIIDRARVFSWKGAVTAEQKAILIRQTLEDLVGREKLSLSDRDIRAIGLMAAENRLSGRDIERICGDVADSVFDEQRLGEVYDLRDDYDKQKAHFVSLYSRKIVPDMLVHAIGAHAEQKKESILSSLRHRRNMHDA